MFIGTQRKSIEIVVLSGGDEIKQKLSEINDGVKVAQEDVQKELKEMKDDQKVKDEDVQKELKKQEEEMKDLKSIVVEGNQKHQYT